MRCTFLAALAIALITVRIARCEPTPAGTSLQFSASASYADLSGRQRPPTVSPTVSVKVLRQARVTIALGTGSAAAPPGETTWVPITVTNGGNDQDRLPLRVTVPPGWFAYLLRQDNLNSAAPDPEPVAVDETPLLPMGRAYYALLAVVAPPEGTADDAATVVVSAQSGYDATCHADAGLLVAVSSPVLPGDLDGDGRVTVTDATILLRIAMGLLQPTPRQSIAGDVAPRSADGTVGDGRITTADVARLLRHLAGVDGDTWR